MDWHYSDYLRINQDFIEVFSAEQDEQNAEAWMSFIPHPQMLDLLRALLDALERKTPQSLWMHGQYGTGKTMCLFVLKHLLEDPWPAVERYLEAQGIGADLRKRIHGVRERGQGLSVYLSGSGHIDSNLKFMASLERAVQEGIGRRGGQAVVGPLFEAVLARIESPGINWPALYDQHRNDFLGLASSAQEVIDQLHSEHTASQPRLALLERAVRALQSESIVVLDSAARIKDWLDEVIRVNDLKWIVVMWDEFTEFFGHGAGLDGLQEMAQYTAKAPFYLLLATHRPPENVERVRADDWRKIRDRFRTVPYLMESVTANKLIARVIQVLPRAEEDWRNRRVDLWQKVKPVAPRLLTAGGTERLNDYEELTPLHPYTAFALSRISQQYSSANRTVFRFMKALGPNGFPQFLQDFPDIGWEWYTADGLWDFFFSQAGPDTPREFLEGINYYQSRQADISDAMQRRAFKATMLLITLERALAGEERVRPTLANLAGLFAGTPLRGQLPQVMDALAHDDLVRRVGSATGERTTYTIQSTRVDSDVINSLKTQIGGFEKLFGVSGSVGGAVRNAIVGALPEHLNRRLTLSVVTYGELRQRRERAAPAAQPFQIATLLTICKTDEEVVAARDLVGRLSTEHPTMMWVLLDDPFGAGRFEQYLDDRAHELYFTELKDSRNARFYKERYEAAIKEWLQALRNMRLTAWAGRVSVELTSLAGFQSAFERAAEARFPYRPELVAATDPLFRGAGFGVAGAEVGLGIRVKAAPYDQVLTGLSYLHTPGQPLQEEQLKRYPDHPVSHMKAAVDELLSRDSVNLKALWDLLQAPPFGLPPAPISITLFGLLLRECGTGYYWSDGITSHSLDPTKLAQLIKETMDGKSGQVLQRSSLEERRLCGLLREVFQLDEESARYLLPARDALRGELLRKGYPLWALNCYLQSYGRPPCAVVTELCALISARDMEAYATQEQLGLLLSHLERDRQQLSRLNDPDSYEAGMRYFLEQKDGRLGSVLGALGLSTKDLMTRIKSVLEEEVWLWGQDEVATRLPAILDELQLVGALKEFTGGRIRDLEGGLAALESMLRRGKLPLLVLSRVADRELSECLTSLAHATRLKLAYPEKAALARMIGERKEGLYDVMAHPLAALRGWASAVMGIDLTDAEAEILLVELPDISMVERDEQVQMAVRQLLTAMERRRAIADLREAWLRHTGTTSPDDWSNKHGIPIRWLFDSAAEAQTLEVVQDPERILAKAVREAQGALESLGPKLQALSLDGKADKQFIALALGDYAIYIQGQEDLHQLRQHVARLLGKPIAQWRQQEVRTIAVQWVKSQYQSRYLALVMRQLEATPAADLRALLREFLQDPLVGVRLLKMESQHDDYAPGDGRSTPRGDRN